MTACVLFIGCPAEEKPPPIMPELPHGFAPYIDEEEGRLSAEIMSLEAEIERLEDEIRAIEEKAEDTEIETLSQESGDEEKPQVTSALSVEATAYTAYCEGCSGITATGVDVRNTIYYEGKRIVAVDPSVIPLYSTVRVMLGDGSSFEAVALDTGGAIKGNRIDILHATKEEALSFGRQTVAVEIFN